MQLESETATGLRKNIYGAMRSVSKGKRYLVSSKNSQAVLMSLLDYEKLLDENDLLRALAAGVKDIDEGRFVTHAEALREMKRFERKWK